MVARQMASCWSIEPGARDARNLIVEVRVFLNPDGSVLRTEIVDVARMNSDSFFRSAAENAQRSVLRCSPFSLPADKFEIWRELNLKFDPSGLLG